jgi:hypothetical protein
MAKDTAKQAARDGVKARREAAESMNAEYYAREAAAKPTPTQEENDLAKVGALDIDDKEDDGSEPEGEAVRRVMESRIPGNNPYETRDASLDTARRPGRPRKVE